MFPILHGVLSQRTEQEPATGWWDDNGNISGALAAWQAKGAASYAASLLDLTGNGHTLVQRQGVVPWSSGRGWEFDNSQSLDTMIVPDDGYSVLVQFSNVALGPSNNDVLIGLMDVFGGNDYCIHPFVSTNHVYRKADGIRVTRPGNITEGNMGMSGYDCYLDGAPDGAFAPSAYSYQHTMTVGGGKRRQSDQLIGFFITADIIAVAIYDTVLSADDMATIAGNMAAL